MVLEDVDPQVFGILANWLYSEEVCDAEKNTPDLVACAKLWVLADKFLIIKLQNDAMSQIWDILESARGSDEVTGFGEFCRIAAETKPEDNPLLRITINMLSSHKRCFDEWLDELPHSILLPVSKNLMLYRQILGNNIDPTLSQQARWVTVGVYFVKELAEKNSREAARQFCNAK